MLYDVRTYECRPGTIKMHLDLYEKHGKAPQSMALGNPLAYLVGETGNPNRYIHIWFMKMPLIVKNVEKMCWQIQNGRIT